MGSGAERGNSPPLSDADIEAVEGPLAAVVGLINASTARLVDLVALALETGVWQQAGIRSPEHWLAWKAGVSPRRAGRLVATARRQAELPVTAAAFATGSLSEDQVTEVALHVPAAHDAEVAALATQTTVTQLRKVARGYAFDPAPEPTDQPPPAPTPQDVADRNRVRFGFGDDQRWHLHADLDAELGALVERALQASRDADEGQASGRVTWADALVRLSDAALVGLAGGRPAGERHQVIVHVRADRPEAPSHLHLGPAVPAAVRRLLSCDSTVRYLLEDAEGVPIKLGRRQRTVSAALRVLVEDRHHGTCARPGCTRSRGLHIHHLHHWEDGGATDPDNLVPLCGRDHRLHHLGLLGIRGDGSRPASLVFTDHRGRVLARGAQPSPLEPGKPLDDVRRELDLPAPRWDHPPGEPLDPRWVTFHDPPEAA